MSRSVNQLCDDLASIESTGISNIVRRTRQFYAGVLRHLVDLMTMGVHRDDCPMEGPRAAFLDAATCAAELLGRTEVANQWNEVSVLAEFSISALAGHLLRAIKTVELYLDGPEPTAEPLDAASYYQTLAITPDISSQLNRDVRERGAEMSAAGPAAVAEEARAVTERLTGRLADEAGDREIQVLGNLAITLDEYLRTRVVELVVHADDLVLSAGLDDGVAIAPSTTTVAILALVDLARLRHGDLAVVRALTRRERDAVSALRVL